MSSDPRLMALPAMRHLAEELAREARNAHASAIWSALYGSYGQALVDALPRLWVYEEAHLSLLSDLTRPASRDAVARLVAAKARIKVYALHALLAGAIPYPPEWPTDLCDRVAAAKSEGEALTLIALAVFGGAS